MEAPSKELGPAAAYSAQVAAWLSQAYHAQLMQHGEANSERGLTVEMMILSGFQGFLAYQSMSGRFSGQQQTSQQQPGAHVNMDLNLPGGGGVRNINIPAGVNNLNLNLQLNNNNNNNNNVPLLRATLVQVSVQCISDFVWVNISISGFRSKRLCDTSNVEEDCCRASRLSDPFCPQDHDHFHRCGRI